MEWLEVWNQTTTAFGQGNNVFHIHEACEFLYLQQGEAEMQIGDKRYLLKPQYLVIVSRLEVHKLTPLQLPYTRIGLNIDDSALSRIGIPPYLSAVMMNHGDGWCHLFDLRNSPKICRLMEEICREQMDDQPGKKEMLGVLLHTLLLHLYRMYPERFQVGSGDTLMEEARQHIEGHFADAFSVQELAARYYLTPSHFILRFKKHSGYTPQKYRNLCRMAHARYLLMEDKLELSEIAERCGFSDLNGFVRCFREMMNITPGRFRTLSRNKTLET